jgi:hypothetical protein
MQMMNGKWYLLASIILAAGLLLAPPTAAAAEGIDVVKNEADYDFAQQITFTLVASSDSEIAQVYLFFRAAGDVQAEPVRIDEFEPGHEINVEYVHDLRPSPLPPFASITFWWQLEDNAGNVITLENEHFQYEDNRFLWKLLGTDDGSLTVHWIEGHGDPIFGQTALDVATASREEINTELRAPLPPSIDIYIYDTQENLKGAMLLTGREWMSGQAHPDLGVVLVAMSDQEGYKSRMMRDIPHEITHLLVYQAVTQAGYRYVPEWLDEGLATANEQLPLPEHALVLEEARTQGQLIPLEDLCVPFSPDPHTAFLSYAQSGSVLKFIRKQYGAPGVRALLQAYADGDSCTGGVQRALNISFGDLEAAWRDSLGPEAPPQRTNNLGRIGIWVSLWLLSLLVVVPMIGRSRRQR